MSQRTTAGSRRRLSRTPVKATVDRRELIEAIGAVVGILVVTALLIWGMRPGGILGRQPRVVLWLIIIAVVFTVAVRLLVLPGRRFDDNPRVGWGIAAGITVIVAALTGFFWPSGLIVRDDSPEVFIPDVGDLPVPSDDPLLQDPLQTPVEDPLSIESPAEDPTSEDVPAGDTTAPAPEG